MRSDEIVNYREPGSVARLVIETADEQVNGRIKTGTITSQDGSRSYPIRDFVPRFVAGDNYARSFAMQWSRYRATQLDSHTGLSLSHDRFFETSGWTAESLRGLRVLEAGCGAGRFTEIVLGTGAKLFSIDYSESVDVVYSTFGSHPGLHLAQADIYALPFPQAFFDRIFCYGVLQHTPDPRRALSSLVPYLRPGGLISIDIYRLRPFPSRWNSKYLWRPLTRRLKPETLFRIVEWFVPRWLPVDRALSGIPLVGAGVASLIPCWNYTGIFPLTPEQIEEWGILDTFDALSPRYDKPATLRAVRRWTKQAGLTDIQVRRGGNGIIGNARRP